MEEVRHGAGGSKIRPASKHRQRAGKGGLEVCRLRTNVDHGQGGARAEGEGGGGKESRRGCTGCGSRARGRGHRQEEEEEEEATTEMTRREFSEGRAEPSAASALRVPAAVRRIICAAS